MVSPCVIVKVGYFGHVGCFIVGLGIRVLSFLANRRSEPWDPKVDIDFRSVRRITRGLRGGSGSMFRLGDLHMEPPATQSPCFVYLQANNDMYIWNQIICA
jgi:hypothetical protein